MKTTRIIFALLVSLSSHSVQSESSIYRELVYASNLVSEEISISFTNSIIATLDEAVENTGSKPPELTPEDKKLMLRAASKYFGSESNVAAMENVYRQIYTKEEAKELTVFYKSSAGKKFVQSTDLFEQLIGEAYGKAFEKMSEEISEIYIKHLK